MSIVARLIEAGTPADLIEEVAMLVAEKRALDERKAKAAERQRRKRERDAESRDVTECHVTERDERDDPRPLSPNENNSNPHTPTPVNIPRARKGGDFPMLDCTDPKTWGDFLKNRKLKRLPNTATAHERLRNDLARWSQETGWPPGEVFKVCTAKGWGAIYDPRDDEKARANDNRNSKSGRGAAERARANLGVG